jgi:deaminated glutathione amidase
MQSEIQAAAIQLNANGSRAENVAKALQMIDKAAAGGARLIVLPELFNGYGDLAEVVAQAETIPGPTSEALCQRATQHGIWLCGGSLCERSDQPGRGYNTSLLISPEGRVVATYRKVHLFDVNVPGNVNVCESSHMLPGEPPKVVETELARFGTAICYDLRFPELFRRLSQQGMEVLLFPSAFTAATGKDHWHVLVRARAIENQCYVIAANQCGRHNERLASFGHSLIVDPWGRILAEAGDEEMILTARLDGIRLASTREVLPALKNRKL